MKDWEATEWLLLFGVGLTIISLSYIEPWLGPAFLGYVLWQDLR